MCKSCLFLIGWTIWSDKTLMRTWELFGFILAILGAALLTSDKFSHLNQGIK